MNFSLLNGHRCTACRSYLTLAALWHDHHPRAELVGLIPQQALH